MDRSPYRQVVSVGLAAPCRQDPHVHRRLQPDSLRVRARKDPVNETNPRSGNSRGSAILPERNIYVSQHDDTDSRAVEQLAGNTTANESVHSLTRPSARSGQLGGRQARLRRLRNDELGATTLSLPAKLAPRELIKVDGRPVLPDSRNGETNRPIVKLKGLSRTVELKEPICNLKVGPGLRIAEEQAKPLLAAASSLGHSSRGLALIVDWVTVTNLNEETSGDQSPFRCLPSGLTNLERSLRFGLSKFMPPRPRGCKEQQGKRGPSEPGVFSPPGPVMGDGHSDSSAMRNFFNRSTPIPGGIR